MSAVLVTDFVGEKISSLDAAEGGEHYWFRFDNGYVVSVRNCEEPSLIEKIIGRMPAREGQTWELALAFNKPSEILPGLEIEVTPTKREPFDKGFAYAQDSAGVNALLAEVQSWEKVQ